VKRDPRVLTEPDLELLRALAEQRIAVIDQAAHWLGVGPSTAQRRVRRLREAGLLESGRLFERGSPMVRITAAGLKRIDSPLGKPGQKLDEYRHDVGVGWVWTAARDGVFGEMAEIISERGMRSHDTRLERMAFGERLVAEDGEPRGVGIGAFGPDGKPQRHYPDLLMRSRAGHTIAVELELSSKGRSRLEKIMDAYASDGRIDAVLYLVPDARMAARIREAASRAGIPELVHVRQIAAGGIGGVAEERVPSATRERSANRALARGQASSDRPSGRGGRGGRGERGARGERGERGARGERGERGGRGGRGDAPEAGR
jgi:DNA-binding transcriptional ArsR family regulator